MKMAKELRTYLAEDLGLTVKPHKALTEPQVTFAVMLGLMREQATESRRTPKVPCYFINRFPDQLTGLCGALLSRWILSLFGFIGLFNKAAKSFNFFLP